MERKFGALIIGDEILSGKRVDQHFAKIAGLLSAHGLRLSWVEYLGDERPRIVETLKRSFAGWNCYLLTADLRMPKLMRLTPSKKTPLFNGAIECRLFEFKMVAGSNRK